MNEVQLTADMHVADAGRTILSQQLAIMLDHAQVVRANADEIAVHEMRKSIRRTFTCFKLFNSYFEPGTFKRYKRGLRRIMQRLGKCRDLAVARMKLDLYITSSQETLLDLSAYWHEQQVMANAILMDYLTKSEQQAFLAEYQDFTETPGMGVCRSSPWAPVKFRHYVPILIYERVAAVRAFDDKVAHLSASQLHRLRIQFKELRYTLEFLSPLLGPEIELVLQSLKQSQEILGDLNDTQVALRLMDEGDNPQGTANQYRAYQEREQQRLIQSFIPAWQQFDRPQWRRDLAESMVML